MLKVKTKCSLSKYHIMKIFKTIIVLWLCCFVHLASAQKILNGEYFIDQDPSPGKGIAIVGAEGDSINLNNFEIPTNGLGLGSHTLGIRVRDSLGFWSPNYCTPFSIIKQVNDSITANTKLVGGEYFFGIQDPGIGNGIAKGSS